MKYFYFGEFRLLRNDDEQKIDRATALSLLSIVHIRSNTIWEYQFRQK